MINPSYDDFAWADISPSKKASPVRSKGGKIENQDGSTMFVAEAVTIEIEEAAMSLQPNNPLSFKAALTIAGSTLLIVGTVMWSAYTQIQGQITDLRGEISTLRSSNHDDFNRVADKLDAITQRLDDKIDKSAEKTDSKLDKINESLNELRQAKPAQ